MTSRQSSSRAPRPDDGFTLLEVLVALSLAAVVMVALFALFNSVTEVASGVKSRERNADGERAFEMVLFDDLRSVYAAASPNFRFTGKDGSFLGMNDEFLSFCTSASLNAVGSAASLSLQRVEYLLRGDGDGRTVYRREKAHCGLSGDWDWVEVPVLRSVEEIDLEYLDQTDGEFRTEWAGSGGHYPSAVRVTVEFLDGQERTFALGLSAMARKRVD